MTQSGSLAQEFFIAMGKISERSDVEIRQRNINARPTPDASGFPFSTKAWASILPEEMAAFFEKVNGALYSWSFAEEESWHGPYMPALVDGKKTVELRNNRYALPLINVGSFPVPLEQDGGFVDKKWKMLLFNGSDDAAGLVMFFDKEGAKGVYTYHNDGDVVRYADDFAQAMRDAMRVGFCHMWHMSSHPITEGVQERLSKKVAPRYTSTLRVEEVEDCGYEKLRWLIGQELPDHPFDETLKAMKRKERAAKLTPEQRGDLFAELFQDPDAVDDALAKKLRVLNFYTKTPAKERTQEDYRRVFHCGDETPLTLVSFSVEGDVEELPRDEGFGERLFLGVEAFESLRKSCPFDVDIARYCPPFLYPQPLFSRTFGYHKDGRLCFWTLLPRDWAKDIKPGTYTSHALPSLVSKIGL